MKKLKLFFACLLMAVLSIGQVWATDATTSWDFKALQATSGTTTEGVSWETGKTGSATATACNATNGLVLYGVATGGGFFQTTSATSGTITNVNIVSAAKKNSPTYTIYCSENGTDWTEIEGAITPGTKDLAISGSYTYLKIANTTAATAQLAVSSIVLSYESGGSTKTLTGVTVSGEPTTTSYYAGQDFDPAGLTVTGTYSDASQQTFTSGITWAYNPSQTLALNQTSIGVTATVSEITSAEFTVNDLTVIEAPAAVNYEKVTAAPSDWSGEYLIVYENGATAYVWTGVDAVSCYATATISNDVIAQPEGTSSVTIASMEGGYSILVNGGTNDGKYIQNNGTSNGIKFVNAGVATTLTYENNAVTITCGGKMFRYNNTSGNDRFRYFGSAQQVIQLYKKVDGTAKPSAELAYADAQKLAKVGAAFTAPTLTNPHTVTVTYESDNTEVATVDPATGAVSIVAAGKAVITASFAGNDDYKAGSASYTIVVTEHAGTEADPYSVADAKIVIDAVGTKENAYVSGIVSSIYSTSLEAGGAISFYISADGATSGQQLEAYKCLSLNSEAFTALSDVKTGATVIITGTLKKFSSTYEFDQNCHLVSYVAPVAPKQHIANDQANPYTVAQALVYAADGVTYDLDDYVYVRGVVYDVKSFNNGAMNIFIKDADAENSFELFKCAGINDGSATTPFEALTDVQAGDIVIGYGQLTVFNTVYEFKQGNYLVDLDRPAVAVTGVTVESTASVAIGGHVTLHASVEPSTATNKTINWSVQSGNAYASVADGVVTGIAEGTAVIRAASDEDASIYAECTVTVAPLSPWATTYTSNVAMAHTGSGVDNGTITIGTDDPYILVKAGASSSTGTIVVTVPKGTTDLHFHAFAWGGKTAKIELAGVENASVSEFDLAGEAGASGSGNDFTLQGDPVDQYFHVSFDAVAAETEITFSKATGSADNRFFFYGVNQVGGLILESISVSGTATALEYNEGDHFSPAGLGVTGHYSDASTAPITEGIVWAFDPDPLTEGTESVSVTATAGGFTSAAFVVDGLTVAGAAPLSPWASVYTSNVEIASNTAAHVTINEENFDAAKTSKGASATITLPQGVTTIHLHLVAWSGEAQTVSVTGDCFNEAKELTIVANAGVSGSGTTYDLGESGTDYYFSLTPDNEVAANTVITIAAASGKRFVLFGVNQEGGVLPVLESIEISGDLSTKTGYKVGDALDLDGLTVEATYSIGGVAQTPVDITNKLGDGLTLTYDPLVENQTEVTITASYEGKTDDITITGLEVAAADPKIYVSTLNVNFASVEVGESVPAAETVTVTLTNVASVTATLGGTNADAFSVSPASLTESGDITISILANTDAAASYSATLTISDGEEGATDKTVNLSFAVIEPVVTEEYQLVSDVTSLAAGDQIIIVAENEGDYYTLDGSISSQYFPSTAVSIAAGIITAPSTSAIILGKDGDNWTMSMGGQLIGATAAKKASLGNGSASNTWTIAIAENVATITNTTTTYGSLQFNYNNGSNSRFLNYTSAQTAVAIYKKVTPEPAWVEVRTGLEVNRHYTVCLEKNITNIDGATFWNLRYKNASDTEVYLESVDAPEAGKPYIIQATKATLKVVYGEETAVAPVDNGALRGSFDGLDVGEFAALTGTIYILKENAIRPRTAGNFVGDHRAYILYSELIVGEPAPQPGRQIRKMPMAPQVATGIDALNVSDKPVKMVIDGQLFILRGEKMYDATGHLVR